MAAKSTSAGEPAAPSQDNLTDALAEAAWIEADESLAEAVGLFDELSNARGARRRGLLDRLGQALTRAARRRGLTRLGEAGAIQDFDPDLHEVLNGKGGSGPVMVVARGVARGRRLLRKARARRIK